MSYLIDTDIIIYSLKNNETVRDNFAKYANALKAISVISYGELLLGALRSQQITRNTAVVRRIAGLFPIIEVSSPVMETFAEIKAALLSRGSPLDDMDLIIASTALIHNLALVTNNARHFARVPGLKIENWAKK
ncbi:MAG TPA: type II toxin-antitoxin system VapC family toxin [Chitinivibrionales bacterium]|jgi:tRNA(fMet)-specific endonuclease VapC|nr:type II toxin-antitoxin system VapC family toxin [Chitinivibrionales bacterium]